MQNNKACWRHFSDEAFPAWLMDIMIQIETVRGAKCYFVGGCVRDIAWNHVHGTAFVPKDWDVEVHGVTLVQLMMILDGFGTSKTVGSVFGVTKFRGVDGVEVDFALPRTERHLSYEHNDVEVTIDPEMGIEAASMRRDFTINAMAFRPSTGELFTGPAGKWSDGIFWDDLYTKTLRPVSKAFSEDPLRVLRGMQFVSRLQICQWQTWAADDELIWINRLKSGFTALSRERVWDEWVKWANGDFPALGLEYLKWTGWITLFPQLNALIGCEQDPEWHPEGDAWTHTLHTVTAASQLAKALGLTGFDLLVQVFGALCHDFGKPATTAFVGGHWRSNGHAEAGEAPTRAFLSMALTEGQKADHALIEAVVKLVKFHMIHIKWEQRDPSDDEVWAMAETLSPLTILDLAHCCQADVSGRPPLPEGMPEGIARLLVRAVKLGCSNGLPKPILNGEDLINRGLKPGPIFGVILRKAFAAQKRREFRDRDGALQWLTLHLDQNPIADL